MLAKEITYTDYNGVERTETYRFNLTKTELIEMDAMIPGGMDAALTAIANKKDTASLLNTFKMIIRKAYGVKSDDGRRFEKSDAISDAFEQSPAYDKFFMDLISGDGEESLAFIRGILPSDMQADAMKVEKELLAKTGAASSK
jgi:hypothetical protein